MTGSDYLPLREHIRSRISSWTGRFLSFTGCPQLLNSVLSSLSNFWLAASRLPNSCIKEIDKLFAAFLWLGPKLNGRKAKLPWHVVCRPYRESGLGLRSLKEVNTVCILKLIWRLTSAKISLRVGWVHVNLIRNESLWSVKESSSSGLWMWTKILLYRAKAQEFHKIEVKSGHLNSFWHDIWSPLGKLYDRLGMRGMIDMGVPLHATVADVLSNHRRRHHRLVLLNQIEDHINTTRLAKTTEVDRSVWLFKEDTYKNNFVSKHIWIQIREQHPMCEWYKGVWFPFSTPKYSFMTWLAFHGRLTTSDKLSRWNTRPRVECVFCGDQIETLHHLFFICPYSAQVWSSLAFGILQSKFKSAWNQLISFNCSYYDTLSKSQFIVYDRNETKDGIETRQPPSLLSSSSSTRIYRTASVPLQHNHIQMASAIGFTLVISEKLCLMYFFNI